MSPEFDAGEFVKHLMKSPTQRDQQVKVGASDLSNGCSRCLADAMLRVNAEHDSGEYQSRWWMGAVVGTAIHALLEDRASGYVGTYLTEQRVILGEIPGYGVVKSTTDAFQIPTGTSVDYKTTTREKLGFIKRAIREEPTEFDLSSVLDARFKVANYFRQTLLYGLGLENAGYTVNKCTLVFICRDGKSDDDIWSHTIPYSRAEALLVWQRAVSLWAWLQAGNDPRQLESAPQCYYCNSVRDWSK